MDDECFEELGRPISQMKVTELRDELAKRALSKSGNKKELIDRLRADIHRQSAPRAAAPNVEQLQSQQNPQQQAGVAQQLVGQMDASNQIAYQMNRIYPQQTQMPTSIPAQYHLPQMQQQLIAGIQNNYQASADNLQQQAQQQLASNVPQDPQTPSQPPIDMRVPQSTTETVAEKDEVQSLDLSANASSQTNQSSELIEVTATQSEESNSVALDELSGSGNSIGVSESNDEPVDLDQSTSKSDLIQSATERETEEQMIPEIDQTREPTGESSKEDAASDTGIREDESQPTAAEVTTDSPETAKSANEAKVSHQAPISLKRGISDPKMTTGNREKRRKWSAKPEVSQIISDSQSKVMAGGISSQRLQELIDVMPPDAKNAKQSSQSSDVSGSQETKNVAADTEGGQVLDVSDEGAKDSAPEKPSVVDPAGPQTTEAQGPKEQKPEPEPEIECEPSNVLLVQNLVRPFTINSLKEVLSQHGPIIEDKFWTDKVKSKCCVVYESIEVAQLTKESLNGQQWPPSNPKTLKITFSTEEALLEYQKSDIAKPTEPAPPIDTTENGGGDQSTKLMTDRLGDRVDDKERGSEQIKKRLGERVSEVGAKSSTVNREGGASRSQELDDLFKKTNAVPHLFWLPLTEDQAEVKAKERANRESRIREVSKSRRPPPRYRSPVRPRNRSSPVRRSPPRRRSPARYRSPARQRSPPGRSSPPRYRSPLRRRSPIHRSPGPVRRSPVRRSPAPIRRSPGPIRRSPGPIRRSPGPIRRSPGPIRRSPGPIRRSPGPIRRSPGPIRRSPNPIRRSPGPIRRSPGPTRRSPVLIRRSPGPIHRALGPNHRQPGLIRRSPQPMRGTSPPRRSPVRKRSPVRRRSPAGRYISPDQSPTGYDLDLRRNQRSDRLR